MLLLIRRIFFAIIYHILHFLSGFIRRDEKVIVFGSYGIFNDNSRYLYEEMTSDDKYRSIWISRNKKSVEMAKKSGGEAYFCYSIKGIYYCLIAKTYIYSAYVTDINYFTSKGATLVNLWHGVPIKRIEFDIMEGPLYSVFSNANFLQKFLNPRVHNVKQYVLSPSDFVSNYCIKSAFRVEESNILTAPYPRVVNLMKCDALDNDERFTFLYTPTWRDDEQDFLGESEINFRLLNDFLVEKNARLLIKFHPNTSLSLDLNEFESIFLVDSKTDSNVLLKTADCLITDYSSIFFDYLALDKPIIFFAFDLKRYMENRDLYINIFNENAPGEVCVNFTELMEVLDCTINLPLVSSVANEMKEKFWGDLRLNNQKLITDISLIKNRI